MNIEGFANYKYDTDFLDFAKQFDVIGLCETWGSNHTDFDGTLHNYEHFDYIRKRSRHARRSSGGGSVVVKNYLVSSGNVKRIFDNMNDCVVLLFSGGMLNIAHDIIMIFAYISPENSPVYNEQDTNGIELLNNQISEIVSQFPTADIFLAGDLNTVVSNCSLIIFHMTRLITYLMIM
ncbi:MAG: endonuclease/exonuclease/phosphatase family protein [Sedimenticola sp.]